MSTTNFDQFSSNYKDLLDRSIAVSGEGSGYFSEYKARYITRTIGEGFCGKILDYGCGVGLLSCLIKKYLPKAIVHGYDPSAESVKMVPPNLASEGTFSSDISRLHYDYELAIISNVMHHVTPKDRQQTISEIAGRLATAGRLVLFEHNPLNPLTQWVVKHCPFDDDAILLSPGEARSYFLAAKLAVLRRDYIVFFPRTLSLFRPLEPMLGWLPAGGQYAMLGEKYGQ
ncbi:MAG TPA: class I SAM-dependent methyltransferase [Terriglobales bacterium]|jgi:SAM-dependent methyltransferase|nr:class I SAM-dependent methyltransferase [Terriglobales bacterium]